MYGAIYQPMAKNGDLFYLLDIAAPQTNLSPLNDHCLHWSTTASSTYLQLISISRGHSTILWTVSYHRLVSCVVIMETFKKYNLGKHETDFMKVTSHNYWIPITGPKFSDFLAFRGRFRKSGAGK